jgi:hypothetical protein
MLTAPIGLARYGKEFLECALIAGNKVGQLRGLEIVATVPLIYLIGHSIDFEGILTSQRCPRRL